MHSHIQFSDRTRSVITREIVWWKKNQNYKLVSKPISVKLYVKCEKCTKPTPPANDGRRALPLSQTAIWPKKKREAARRPKQNAGNREIGQVTWKTYEKENQLKANFKIQRKARGAGGVGCNLGRCSSCSWSSPQQQSSYTEKIGRNLWSLSISFY